MAFKQSSSSETSYHLAIQSIDAVPPPSRLEHFHLCQSSHLSSSMSSYPILFDFDNLKELRKSEMNMLSCSMAARFSSPIFVQLFSRIDHLKSVMPPMALEISMDDLPERDLWVMRIMEIEPEVIPLSSKCDELKGLLISCDRVFEQASMGPMMACKKLVVLWLCVGVASLRDNAEILTSIATQRCLEVAVDTPEVIEFFQADESTIDLRLTSLDAIIIIYTHRGAPTSSPGFCKIYESILSSHPNLKRFCVEGADINPLLVFQEPGQESRRAQWVCTNLEHLGLTLSWPASSDKTFEEMRRRWDAVFIQIDKLEHSESLSIESEDLDEYPGHGFLQYCHHLSHLESLVLAAPGPIRAWREPQINSLLARGPRLRNLDLGCLKHANGRGH